MAAKRTAVIGLDRMGGDGDIKCRVCGASPKSVAVLYFNELAIYLCPICEGTLLSIMLNNYLRRQRRRKPVVKLLKEPEVELDSASQNALEALVCD